jgi:hypothetical protein
MGEVDVDDLYGLPLDRFVPERNALAREIRKAGDRERADEVAALKKPSVAAWAVNQLVRTQRKAIAALLDAGDALRSAQDDVLAGRGDAQSLRAAVDGERKAVEALTDAVRGLLSSEGEELSDTMVERVSDTLHAAALDDDAREQVTGGHLERELRHVGLGGLGALGGGPPAPPAPPRRAATKKEAGSGRQKKRAVEHERALRDQAKKRDEARKDARATEREARRRAERAERAAQVAHERRDSAAAVLRDAEEQLEGAQAALAEAQAQLRDAEAAVHEVSS